MENRTTIRVPTNQIINEDTTALYVLFQTKYFRSKAMAKYMSAIRASNDARLSIINNRLKKLDMIARLCPLNQPASKIVEIMKIGMLMAIFSMSTTARLARRVFGTVRKDLNRAITARIEPLPNVAPRASKTVKKLITTFVESGFGGYMTKVFTELLSPSQSSLNMVKIFKRLYFITFFCSLV